MKVGSLIEIIYLGFFKNQQQEDEIKKLYIVVDESLNREMLLYDVESCGFHSIPRNTIETWFKREEAFVLSE
jgi:hypothetical protein